MGRLCFCALSSAYVARGIRPRPCLHTPPLEVRALMFPTYPSDPVPEARGAVNGLILAMCFWVPLGVFLAGRYLGWW